MTIEFPTANSHYARFVDYCRRWIYSIMLMTNGDTKSCYTYMQIGKNLQLPVAVLLKVSHFLDDVTRGMVRRVNVLQMQISATLTL